MAIAVIWLTVIIGMHRTGLGLLDARPISYLGVAPVSQTPFSSGLILSALLIIIFGDYLRRTYSIPGKFFTAVVIGQIAQIITALAPNRGHTQVVHTTSAFIIVFTLPPLMQLFAKAQPKGDFR